MNKIKYLALIPLLVPAITPIPADARILVLGHECTSDYYCCTVFHNTETGQTFVSCDQGLLA